MSLAETQEQIDAIKDRWHVYIMADIWTVHTKDLNQAIADIRYLLSVCDVEEKNESS